jgi:general secretion pathway protein L
MSRTSRNRSQRLLVFLPPQRAAGARPSLTPASIMRFIALGASTSIGDAPISLLPEAAQVDLVFDSADVFVAVAEPPRLSDARLRQALPNLLEDRLLADAADCHYAFERLEPEGGKPQVAVAAIDRALLTRTLDALAAAGLRIRAAYSELYTVPAPARGVLSVRIDRDHGVARSGPHAGFAFDLDGDAPPPALTLAIRQMNIQRLDVYGRDAPRLAAMAEALGTPVEVVRRAVDAQAIESAVNLLQGPFVQARGFAGLRLPRLTAADLRAPLIWLAVAAVTFVGGMNLYWWKLQSESGALRSQMETAFRSAFPEAVSVPDPVRQTRQALGGLRARAGIASPEDFSVLNTRATQLLAMAPIGVVAGVDYRDAALRVKLKPGTALDANVQNALRVQAVQQGLDLRFEGDGSLRLTPAAR